MSDKIEILSRRRSFLMIFMASVFVIWQVPGMDFFARLSDGTMQIADGIVVIGGIAWIIALLALLFTQRTYHRLSADENAALEDELVKANRNSAFKAGYIATMATAALMFALAMLTSVTGIDAAHMVIVAGVAIPMYTFAYLERRNA